MELVKERSGAAGWRNISLHSASCGARGSRASLEEVKTKAEFSMSLSSDLASDSGSVGPGWTMLVPMAERAWEPWPWCRLLLSFSKRRKPVIIQSGAFWLVAEIIPWKVVKKVFRNMQNMCCHWRLGTLVRIV